MSRFKRLNPLAMRYADLRENEPSLENAQIRMSSWEGFAAMGMPLISCKILSGRSNEIHSTLAIKLLAKRLSSPSVKGPAICYLSGPEGSQKSVQALTLSPLAIDHLNPLLKLTPPSLHAFQIQGAGCFLEFPLRRCGVRYLQVSI